MNPLLERVTEFVSANPGCTLSEIARGVRAADGAVRDVLSSAGFYASARDAYPADRAQVYRLASEAAAGLGRAARRSQGDLIAAVLADGQPHSTSEIHDRCGFSRLNSRIAELRARRGMVIECRHLEGVQAGPDAQQYVFHGYLDGFGPSEAAADTSAAAASDGPAAQHRSPAADGHLLTEAAGSSDEQMDLGAAA